MDNILHKTKVIMDSIFGIALRFSPTTSALIVAIIIILVLTALTSSTSRYLFSRGPWGIPILGYYPFLPKMKEFKFLTKLAEKYGDVYLINICGKVYVHISSSRSLKEAFVTKSDCFSLRPQDGSVLTEVFQDGVFAKNGEGSRVWRKFIVHSMREVGLGSREQLKHPIQEAIESTLHEMKLNDGKTINTTSLFIQQCTEVIRKLMLGENSKKEDAEQINKVFMALMTPVSSFEAFLCGRIARYIASSKAAGLSEVYKAKMEMYRLFNKLLTDHERRLDLDNPKDIVDHFLRERMLRMKKADGLVKHFTNEAFAETMFQIYGDGGFTTGSLLSSLMKELAKMPEIQEAMFQEISEVIGTERLVTYEDRNQLPYTNSVIKELMRKCEVLPVFPSLECTVSTTVSGVYIPKGAIVLLNIYALNNNASIYENPEIFEPKRFLDAEDKKENGPLVFGLGKRACLGEMLVMTQLFLFTTAIVQNFKFHLPEVEKSEAKSSEASTLLDVNHIIVTSRKKL